MKGEPWGCPHQQEYSLGSGFNSDMCSSEGHIEAICLIISIGNYILLSVIWI